jgi:hypothetical protein
MARRTLTEARRRAVAEAIEGQPGRFRIQLITPGWGSSGYYGPDVLTEAARARVFPAGMHLYADHPTATESRDLPERSIDRLRGVLEEDATLDDEGGLSAVANVFGSHRVALEEMSSAIGVSIRAVAEVEHGEADGKRGQIVKELVEGLSADFVTHAGRGGRIVEILESARPSAVTERAVEHGVTEATANELREWLQDALRDAYGAEKSWVWVRDFDDTYVWYEHETPDECGTFQHSYELDGSALSLSGDPIEVRMETNYVPVDPAGQSTTESEEDTMPQIEEARLRQLEEAHGRVPTLESERDAAAERATTAESERDQVRQELAAERARAAAVTHARTRVTEANGELPQATVDRIVATATATVPLTESGQLDTTALDTATDTARTAEETYLAGLAESQGAGTPRWVTTRKQTAAEDTEVAESDVDAMIRRRAGLEQKGA